MPPVKCPRCDGWVSEETDSLTGSYLKCLNCGHDLRMVARRARPPARPDLRGSAQKFLPPRPNPMPRTRDALKVGRELKELYRQQHPERVNGYEHGERTKLR